MLGIVQEQHPDRARLFMQWKGMDWPILVDSLNLLGVSAVPLTFAIDEHGIVRLAGLRPDAVAEVETFLATNYPPPAALPSRPSAPGESGAPAEQDAAAWRGHGDARFLWGGPTGLGAAVASYEKALRLEPGDGPAHFRLGTALRARYDSEARLEGDFAAAVAHWQAALEADPNQYIWRRRIQQYGPRLAKPYPFYDWVGEARRAIRARGEEPAPLRVEPGGAELASPSEAFEVQAGPGAGPDPAGRIHRDAGTLIRVEKAVVPPRVAPGGAVRVHLVFRPVTVERGHWNNEVEPLRVWPGPPRGWSVGAGSLAAPLPLEAVSDETRRVEFELRVPEDATPGIVDVPAYALYYVCEDVNGTCLYRRQDVPVAVEVASPPGR
jgi:hypothetical protein